MPDAPTKSGEHKSCVCARVWLGGPGTRPAGRAWAPCRAPLQCTHLLEENHTAPGAAHLVRIAAPARVGLCRGAPAPALLGWPADSLHTCARQGGWSVVRPGVVACGLQGLASNLAPHTSGTCPVGSTGTLLPIRATGSADRLFAVHAAGTETIGRCWAWLGVMQSRGWRLQASRQKHAQPTLVTNGNGWMLP